MEAEQNPLSLLRFYVDVGADECTADTTYNRLTASPSVHISKESNISSIQTQPELIEPKGGAIAALAQANEVLSKVDNIDALKQAIAELETPIKRTAINMLFSEGTLGAKVMLIGDIPGTDEDRSGKAFVGQTGLMLDKIFSYAGLNREHNLYMTYLVNWYTPGNRLPNETEIALFTPFLKKHIELAAPDVIISLGDVVTKALLETTQPITRLRGKWHEYKSPAMEKPTLLMPFLRIEYLLSTPAHKAKAWEDVLKLKAKLQEIGAI